MTETRFSILLLLFIILGIGLIRCDLYEMKKPQQICVITIQQGQSISPDSITRSDCSFMLGDK